MSIAERTVETSWEGSLNSGSGTLRPPAALSTTCRSPGRPAWNAPTAGRAPKNWLPPRTRRASRWPSHSCWVNTSSPPPV